jgi:hypothetical protein
MESNTNDIVLIFVDNVWKYICWALHAAFSFDWVILEFIRQERVLSVTVKLVFSFFSYSLCNESIGTTITNVLTCVKLLCAFYTVNNLRIRNKNSKDLKYKYPIQFFFIINQFYSFKEYNHMHFILEAVKGINYKN